MNHHEIEINIEFWETLKAGIKKAEIRRNDRDYKIGDTLEIYPCDDSGERIGGNFVVRTITHIVHGGRYGIETGYCLLSMGTKTELEK